MATWYLYGGTDHDFFDGGQGSAPAYLDAAMTVQATDLYKTVWTGGTPNPGAPQTLVRRDDDSPFYSFMRNSLTPAPIYIPKRYVIDGTDPDTGLPTGHPDPTAGPLRLDPWAAQSFASLSADGTTLTQGGQTVDLAIGAAAISASVSANRRTHDAVFNILDYGAKVDGIERFDAAMTAGSPNLTCAGRPFTSADVGKKVGVTGAGVVSTDYAVNANDGKLVSTINSVTGGVAVLADAAVNTVTAAECAFGTADDDAVRDAQAAAKAAGGGTVMFPPGRTVVTRPLRVENFVSWAGVHRDVSWVEVIFSAPGNAADGPAAAGTTDWLSCAGRSGANPLTGASFHEFGVQARYHIRPGGYTAPIKALNIYYVNRCAIYLMNVWNTGATAIPFDHQYESVLIAWNIIKNPGRLWPGGDVGGGSGIGIGTHSNGIPEPGLIFGNTILGVGNPTTKPNGQNGIFDEGQSGSDPTTPSQGFRIVDNYVQGMTNAISCEGDGGTVVSGNVLKWNVTGVRITDGQVAGAYPGTDTLVIGNSIIDPIAPSTLQTDGVGILVSSNTNDDVKIRAKIVENQVTGAAGRGIRIACGANNIDGLEVSRNKIRGCGRSGLHITSTGGTLTNLIIEGNQFAECGSLGKVNDTSSLYLSALVDHITLRNNTEIHGTLNGGLSINMGSVGATIGGGIISGNDFSTVAAQTIDSTVRIVGNLKWPGIDTDGAIFVPTASLAVLTGTRTETNVNKRPALTLADAVTTTLGVDVGMSQLDWSTFRIEAVWFVASGTTGNVTWRCDAATWTTSTTFADPATGGLVTTATKSDGTPSVTTVKSAVTADNPFVVVNITRLGNAGTDTCTAPVQLLGVRLVRTS